MFSVTRYYPSQPNGLFYVGAKCETGRPPAYLFILASETLAISIRENSEMQRIKIGNNETKPLRYADDTCVFCVLET